MPERLRLLACAAQHRSGGSGEPEGRLADRRISQRGEPLVRGLLARSERATDLGPARPARPRRVDELVKQLIAAVAQPIGELRRGRQPGERRADGDLFGQIMDPGHRTHCVKANLTPKHSSRSP